MLYFHGVCTYYEVCIHALFLRLDHVSLFLVFHETSGTLTEISSTVYIYIPVSGDIVCVVLEVRLGSESSGEGGNMATTTHLTGHQSLQWLCEIYQERR